MKYRCIIAIRNETLINLKQSLYNKNIMKSANNESLY